MGGHEPEARDGGSPVGRPQPVHGADQLGEVGPALAILPATDRPRGVDVPEAWLGLEVVAVAVDVLPEERDLAVPGGGQGPRLVHDLVERSAALRAAAERDDAVGAGLVAAVDDRQPGADRRVPGDGAARDRVGPCAHQVRGVRDRGPVDEGRRGRHRKRHAIDRAHGALCRRQAQAVDELGLLVRPQEHVDGRVAARQPRTVRFAHRAAGHDHAQAGVRGLEPVQVPLAADDLGLGRLADRAGVDHDEVGGVHRHRLRAARGQQPARHLLGVALVHLAAERPDEERRQGADLGAELLQARVLGHERVARAGCAGDRRGDVEDGQRSGGHAGAHGSAAARPIRPRRRHDQRPSAARNRSTSASGRTRPAWLSGYGPKSPW